MSDELELLDQLGGGPMPCLLLERHVFAGDRNRFLNSLKQMLIDGQIALTVDGVPVPVWRAGAWSRRPHDADTEGDLQRAMLAITDIGLKRVS